MGLKEEEIILEIEFENVFYWKMCCFLGVLNGFFIIVVYIFFMKFSCGILVYRIKVF